MFLLTSLQSTSIRHLKLYGEFFKLSLLNGVANSVGWIHLSMTVQQGQDKWRINRTVTRNCHNELNNNTVIACGGRCYSS